MSVIPAQSKISFRLRVKKERVVHAHSPPHTDHCKLLPCSEPEQQDFHGQGCCGGVVGRGWASHPIDFEVSHIVLEAKLSWVLYSLAFSQI